QFLNSSASTGLLMSIEALSYRTMAGCRIIRPRQNFREWDGRPRSRNSPASFRSSTTVGIIRCKQRQHAKDRPLENATLRGADRYPKPTRAQYARNDQGGAVRTHLRYTVPASLTLGQFPVRGPQAPEFRP